MELKASAISPVLDRRPLVLVVEDDEDSLLLLNQALELFECNGLSATNGRETLSLVPAFQPDLILLDILLPDMDGLEVVRHLRQNPDLVATPIVAVTALAALKDRQQILSYCHDIITKPYILDDLEAVIRRHLNPVAIPQATARAS